MVATTRGPNAPVGTPFGSSPLVVAPHEHVSVCTRYSSTIGSTFGKSAT